jgi:hypothetical protein
MLKYLSVIISSININERRYCMEKVAISEVFKTYEVILMEVEVKNKVSAGENLKQNTY